jgi:hypothetical protein
MVYEVLLIVPIIDGGNGLCPGSFLHVNRFTYRLYTVR